MSTVAEQGLFSVGQAAPKEADQSFRVFGVVPDGVTEVELSTDEGPTTVAAKGNAFSAKLKAKPLAAALKGANGTTKTLKKFGSR